MSTTAQAPLVTGTDFVALHATDFDATLAFYGETLGLPRTALNAERGFAEFETGNLTLSILDPARMGMELAVRGAGIALHVEDVPAARATLQERGVTFMGDTFDTGVCHMAFFTDPTGNGLLLHHRYAPRS
jgi:predicted enzyme related to lactoylglutathione lyase